VLAALTRGVSSQINACELSFIQREPIQFERAVEQHRNYQELLRSLGVAVTEIPSQNDCPDCCFLEDTAIVLDELAIITRPGSTARRHEVDGVVPSVSSHRKQIFRIEAPATLEGGDVLRIGRGLFVGLTQRTNREGIEALRKLVWPFGYSLRAVDVPGALHLKSVCTAVDDHTLLLEPSRVDRGAFSNFDVIEVPAEEWMAANVLLVDGTVCMHSGFPKSRKLLEHRGYQVRTVDISEFLKAEAGLTCMSLLFRETAQP